MRVVREIEIAGRKVQVKELTVGEIRAWLKSSAEGSLDVVDATLFEDFGIDDLRHMTDLSADDIDAMTPAAIRELEKVAREVNADFFGMRSRLVAMGRQVIQRAE